MKIEKNYFYLEIFLKTSNNPFILSIKNLLKYNPSKIIDIYAQKYKLL